MATQERATRIVPHVAQEDHAALLESIELHLAAALAAAYVIQRRR